MKSTGFLAFNRCGKKAKQFAVAKHFPVVLLLFFLFISSARTAAQSCPIAISNNEIRYKRALCINTSAFLEGTVPLGGNGSYRYQWEINRNNCGDNGFEAINGATQKDYIVPANAPEEACYRRVVISGSCQSVSDKLKLDDDDDNESSPAPPAVLVVQPLCGVPTGTITVTSPAPGSGFSYSIDGTTYSNQTGIFAGLVPNTYRVTAKHTTGCITPAAVVTLNSSVLVSGKISPETASLCKSGTVTLTATGGTSYQWYRNGTAINGATAANYLAAAGGTYTADIIVAGCRGKASNEAVVDIRDSVTFSLKSESPGCTVAFGSIEVENASGGSGAGFQYSKDNGATFQQDNSFANLSAGTYQVVVKDGAGCRSSAKPVVIQAYTSTLTASATATGVSCTQPAGSVRLSAGGGTAPYQYRIGNGAYQSEPTFNRLAAGNYTATIKDGGGCTIEVAFTITNTSSNLKAAATVKDAACNEKGAVTLQATGGVLPFQYRLDSGAFQAAAAFANLPAGQYTVSVKDSAGCLFQLPVIIKQAGKVPTLVVTNPAKICAGATQSLQDATLVAGSDQGLNYSYWKDSSATMAVPNPSAVEAGRYFIKATNAEGCFVIKPVTVTVQQAAAGRITASGPTTLCSTQTVVLTATAGQTYQWYRDDVALTGETAATLTPTVSGTYAVRIGDGTCSVMASNTVRVQFQSCIPNPETNVFVPTGFTPNRNGANEVLRPLLYNIATLRYFRVYNRWGQMVFQTSTQGQGWDGTIGGRQQPAETYTWVLECVDNDGATIRQSGRSLLIR